MEILIRSDCVVAALFKVPSNTHGRNKGKTVIYKVNLYLAVAKGAAVFASTLETDAAEENTGIGGNSRKETDITVSEVTVQSVGVITVESEYSNKNVNMAIISHNTKIPAKYSVMMCTVYDIEPFLSDMII